LLQADAALYQAKRDGRNCVVLATSLPPFAEAA
jgi:PleD family two-component response regulator